MKLPLNKIIQLQLRKYLYDFPMIRFGQALFNLGIVRFQNEASPDVLNYAIADPFHDTDEAIVERMHIVLKGKYKSEPFEEDEGELMTIKEFSDNCRMGSFIDYDGYGVYATDKLRTDIKVYASEMMAEFVDLRVDEKLTHVLWFNR